ncbi:MAG: hypothetical protein R3C17_14220 [Planctomycetaceae bacterium]
MSRLGIICGSLVIIGLLVEFWLAAKLGYRRGEVADKLREASAKSEKAIVELDKSAADLRTAQTNLAALKLGWGYEYTFAPANPAPVQNQGGRLFVTGLGSTTPGFTLDKKFTDANGQEKIVVPPIHVFADNGQGKVIYIGEFLLGTGPNELGEQTCVLYPTWRVSPQEMAAWDFSHGVRLRTQIPPGGRAEIDGLNQTIQRSIEQLTELNGRIENQTQLQIEADLALETRRKELLGDAEGADVAERPEFKVGLVQAIENIEEERNALQIEVDTIRRRIQQAVEKRAQLVENVRELAASSSKPDTKVSTIVP